MLPEAGMEERIRRVKERRAGCWCEDISKPCSEHDAYDDGFVDGWLAAEAHHCKEDS